MKIPQHQKVINFEHWMPSQINTIRHRITMASIFLTSCTAIATTHLPHSQMAETQEKHIRNQF